MASKIKIALEHTEIEVKFLEIDKSKLINKLHDLGARDLGEKLIKEIIFYDKNLEWQKNEREFVRLRQSDNDIHLAYKNHHAPQIDGTEEIEITVDDFNKTKYLLEKIGLIAYREQEKRRHKFIFDAVTIDIDTWPGIPTYVELEGKNEKSIQKIAEQLGLAWENAVFLNARKVIEDIYGTPVGKYRKFTFGEIH